MVTLYSPDSTKAMLSAGESTLKKKTKRGYLIEMQRVAQQRPDDASHSKGVLSWMHSKYSLSELYLHNPLLVSILRQMYLRELAHGEFDFALIPGLTEEDNFEHMFYCRRKNLEAVIPGDPKFSAEKKLQGLVRLTDTEEYQDTITIEEELKDLNYFLSLLGQVSHNRAFKVPCRAFWDSSLKKWLVEYPPWMAPTNFNTLGAWICASLERAVWEAYWSSKTQNSLQKNIVEFFGNLPRNTKTQIVGNTEQLSYKFLELKQELSKKSPTIPVFSQFGFPGLNPLGPGILSSYAAQVAGLYSASSRNKIQYFQSNKSVQLILDKLNQESPQKFIEFLSASPLDRAVTILDLVARKVLESIKVAYTQKNAEELLLIYEEEQKHSRSKKKKPRDLSSTSVRSESTNSSSKAKEESELSIAAVEDQVVQELLQSVMNNLISNIQEPPIKLQDAVEKTHEGQFQTVNFKKNKKPRKEPKKNYRRTNKKPNNQTKPKKPLKKENKPGPKAQWQKVTSSASAVLNDSEFPPLLSSLSSKTERLHQEIIVFSNSVLNNISMKQPIIEVFLYKLNEVVTSLFPTAQVQVYGSYGSGLALEVSDIDISICNTNLGCRELIQMACLQLASILEGCGWVLNVSCISTATVPVVKLEFHSFYCAGTGNEIIKADVTFDDSEDGKPGTHMGVKSLLKTCELMESYPQVQYLGLVLKKLLYSHDLNSAYKGGLSSYSLTLWIVAFLESLEKQKEDLGELLLDFLCFYGTKFDPKTQGISPGSSK